MSTNKVYGDRLNQLDLVERETRWDYADPAFRNGIAETFPIDQSLHSVFGASKVAADIMVREYGRFFGMPSCVLRGGCLTGPNHSGVGLHGFLSYLIRCNLIGKEYKVFGFKGKQVRDNLHSEDVARFMLVFAQNPRCGKVYNLGGDSRTPAQSWKHSILLKSLPATSKYGRTLKITVLETIFVTTAISEK